MTASSKQEPLKCQLWNRIIIQVTFLYFFDVSEYSLFDFDSMSGSVLRISRLNSGNSSNDSNERWRRYQHKNRKNVNSEIETQSRWGFCKSSTSKLFSISSPKETSNFQPTFPESFVEEGSNPFCILGSQNSIRSETSRSSREVRSVFKFFRFIIVNAE